MNGRAFLFIAVLLLSTLAFASGAPASAQQSQSAAPKLQALDAGDNDPIPSKIINDMFASCKYNIPERFTPKAREHYCACNAAAVQGNFVMKEYKELQTASGRKPTNKLYEKYITTAVAPCLDVPVEQIEYLDCVLDTMIDIRVRSIPPYCKCVALKAKAHVVQFGDAEIMTRLIQYPKGFKDPVNALWDNSKYLRAKVQAKNDCIVSRNN